MKTLNYLLISKSLSHARIVVLNAHATHTQTVACRLRSRAAVVAETAGFSAACEA